MFLFLDEIPVAPEKEKRFKIVTNLKEHYERQNLWLNFFFGT